MVSVATLQPETATLSLSPEGLFVRLRISANRKNIQNALAIVQEICNHLHIEPPRSTRIILAVEEALLNAIEHAYDITENCKPIDIQFKTDGNEFHITVEDYGHGIIKGEYLIGLIPDSHILDDRGRGLCLLIGLSDRYNIESTSKGTRATMTFQLPINA